MNYDRKHHFHQTVMLTHVLPHFHPPIQISDLDIHLQIDFRVLHFPAILQTCSTHQIFKIQIGPKIFPEIKINIYQLLAQITVGLGVTTAIE